MQSLFLQLLEITLDFLWFVKGPVIIYRLRRRGGGALDFRGDHLIFRRTKGGISRN